MAMQSEPLKTGFLVTEIDGSPEDLPIKLRFPNGSVTRTLSNELAVDFVGGSLPTTYLKVDQYSPQYIINGSPVSLAEPSFTYSGGVLSEINYSSGYYKLFSYNSDGTLATVDYNGEHTKIFAYSSGILTSISVT